LVDDEYRERLLRSCSDPVIRAFWQTEYAAYDSRHRTEAISPIQNKVGTFLSNPFIRSILCQNTSTLDIPKIMNTGKVLIVNLSKGNLGTEPAHLLGALLISAFAQAAEGRRNMPEEERRDFTLYVDEFQNFATDSFASILSEARKWRLSLVAANQHCSQLSDELQQAVFGNAGTLIAFRIGSRDANFLADEFNIENSQTLTQTKNFHAWIKLMRNGAPMEPHLLATLPPFPIGTQLQKVISHGRARHMMPREDVEERIAVFFPKAQAKRPRHRKKRDPDFD
jgi:hypothetical protein